MKSKQNATCSISGIVNECLHEIMEHLLQENVNSVHIKNVRDMLFDIKRICDDGIYVTNYQLVTSRRNKVCVNQKENLYIIAYSLSRFDYYIINDILGTAYNQSRVFTEMENRTGIKAATIRNSRDRFDPYVKQEVSNRKGWHQVKLPPDMLSIKYNCDQLSRNEIISKLRQILYC